jgi:inner membrane protein
MDSLTHIVFGAAVGEALMGKKIGNKAMALGALAATIPDFDVVTALFVDPLQTNELHRGITHSLLFIIILAPLLGLLFSKWFKKDEVSWKQWSLFMFVGLITHPLIDIQTAYGTQLLWPLPNKFTFNNIFVADPFYTLPLLIIFIVALCYKRINPKRILFTRMALIVATIYMSLTFCFKYMAHQHFASELKKQNIAYQRLEAKPTALNAILWCAYVETDSSYLLGYYSLLDKNLNCHFDVFPKKNSLLARMSQEDKVKRLNYLTRNWYNVEAKNDTIIYYDLRFGQKEMNDDPTGFVANYRLYYNHKELVVGPGSKDFKNFKSAFKKLIERILGV